MLNFYFFFFRLSGGATDLCIGFIKCPTLNELLLGGNPWLETDLFDILRIFDKGSSVKLLSLGDQTWITKDLTAV